MASHIPRRIPSSFHSSRAFSSSAPSLAKYIHSEQKEAGELNDLMTQVLEEHRPKQFGVERVRDVNGKNATVVGFEDAGIIRPYDLNRESVKRPTFRGRSFLGPGREARYEDIFLQLGIDPRREADNEELMSGYMTRLGRIYPRNVTGLSQRSQRLLGKAIKRAKMMGVVPILSNSKSKEMGLNQSYPRAAGGSDSRPRGIDHTSTVPENAEEKEDNAEDRKEQDED